ncbi:MAG: oligoribonuclease [Gammaproteobacteria bacterium 28-57-27]|nr:MAG: oligoribonuclease [Gammaproteobacteria bacterium 28-57-27]
MQNHLIWIDLEMTGLEPEQDVIIEIATLVTDEQLNILAEGPVIAVHQPENVLQGMDEWNQNHHSASGLLERVRASPHNAAEAEQLTLDFLRQWSEKRSSPMCGNSICQDRRFLARHMPKLEDFFHYRNLDVSTLKELARRWYPAVPKFEKAGAHRALDDIRASLDELRYYRETLLR